jgi:hypothetical protein
MKSRLETGLSIGRGMTLLKCAVSSRLAFIGLAEQADGEYISHHRRFYRFFAGAEWRAVALDRSFERIQIPIARIIGSVLYRHVAERAKT